MFFHPNIYIHITQILSFQTSKMTSDVLVLGLITWYHWMTQPPYRPWAPWKRPKNFWKLLEGGSLKMDIFTYCRLPCLCKVHTSHWLCCFISHLLEDFLCLEATTWGESQRSRCWFCETAAHIQNSPKEVNKIHYKLESTSNVQCTSFQKKNISPKEHLFWFANTFAKGIQKADLLNLLLTP